MIFDKQNLFSDAQAITADAASTNVIDLGPTGTPVGGSLVGVTVRVTVATLLCVPPASSIR